MRMATPESPIHAVLDAIEGLLEEEREGLRRLDRDVIDRCAQRKASLDGALRSLLASGKPSELERARLERLKAAALVNQMLIAQARNCLKSILAVASGQTIGDAPSSPRAASPAGRLLVQG
jgi:anti-sigma factor ChrR (cupin superfamily)